MSEESAGGEAKGGAQVDLHPPKIEFDVPLSLMKDTVEVFVDGLAGGNFNSEVVRLVLFSDKPHVAGRKVETIRVQSATLMLRRSRLRQFIGQLIEFADNADKVKPAAAGIEDADG